MKTLSPNPFNHLWQPTDQEIIDQNVDEIIDYARTLGDRISGDFDLTQVIFELKDNTYSFVRTGLLAYKVQVYKTYKKVYSSFQEFCEKALGVSHWRIKRAIEAARVWLELARAGFSILPKCESQCRPLWKLFKFAGSNELIANWQTVIETLQPHKITQTTICQILGMESKEVNIRLDRDLLKRLQQKATSEGKTIEELLSEILEEDDRVEEIEDEKLANWQDDLELLIQERSSRQSFSLQPMVQLWESLVSNLRTIFYQVQFLT